MARLSEFGEVRRVVPPGGDLGYAIHQALVETFGEAAPKPFHLRARRTGYELLAYSRHEAATLANCAGLQRSGALRSGAAALGLATMESREMPSSWSAGGLYGFFVRLRPVVRTAGLRIAERRRERDAFLAAIDGNSPAQNVDRQRVYLDWLVAEFARRGGARPIAESSRLSAMSRTRIYRGDRSGQIIDGPDITATGLLEVTEPDRFAELLARGLGRHRAFGFGMLLLVTPG